MAFENFRDPDDLPSLDPSPISDRPGSHRSLLETILDVLATRTGIALALAIILAIALAAGIYIDGSVRTLEEHQRLFDERQLRNSFVAMSDIQRANLVLQAATLAGAMTPALRDEFVEATDVIFARKDNIRRLYRDGQDFPEGTAAIASLQRIVDIADHALETRFENLPEIAADLNAASEEARQNLVRYLDAAQHIKERVLRDQTKTVSQQRRVLWANLAALALVGGASLILLRREVLARQGRNAAERRVAFMAFHDSLTGLPNRVHFKERLIEILDAGEPVALLFADLDEFKFINDTHGHAAGDAVLRSVARGLQSVVEPLAGFAARLGGDELAAVLPTDDAMVLHDVCAELLRVCQASIFHEGTTIDIGISIGMATSTQAGKSGPTSVDQLLRVTDFALYAAKSGGRGRFTVYDETLEADFLTRRAMLQDLPEALRSGDIKVWLQPKVNLSDGTPYAFEALARWDRKGAIVPPGEFISLAEDSGIITDIDLYMLHRAAALLAVWNAENGSEFGVSVNLSALHFKTSRIVDEVQSVLASTGFPPGLLTLEITESVELGDWTRSLETISALRALGCRISIDDFGTGFSSLAYLRSVKADELKIDRSLVTEIETSDEAQFVVDAVIDMAASLNIEVVVEGIETEPQAQVLRSMGLERAQGYLYGKPAPAEIVLRAAMQRVPEGAPEHEDEELISRRLAVKTDRAPRRRRLVR